MKKLINKAVIYCRVSSLDQVKNGHGLSSQEQRCREFAKYRKLQVIDVFAEEGVSGSLIERPAMRQMLNFLRQNPNEQIVVIIDDISRLARGLKAHLELRMAIQDAGGVLQSPSIEFGDDSDSQLVENLLASVSQHHRQKNAEQVKNRMRSRMLGGYWIMKNPVGYKMERRPGQGKVMTRQEPFATIIQRGLEGYACDRFSSVVELKTYFEYQPEFPKDRKGGVHFQRVIDMLNCILYTGYFEFPKWDIPLMKGKHEPIISFETYKRIQDKLHGRSKAPGRVDLNQDFALRGFILCAECNQTMRSCWSSGRFEKYPYYLCKTKGCGHYGKSIKRQIIESEFETLLKNITPTPAMLGLVDLLVDQAREARFGNHEEILDNLKKEKQLIERKVAQFLDRIVAADSQIMITTYERQIKQLEEQRILTEEKIKKCGTVDESFGEIKRTALDFLANPYSHWVSSGLEGKRLVLNATFSRPIAYSRNEGYRTAALSLPFSLLKDFCTPESGMVVCAVISERASDGFPCFAGKKQGIFWI